MQIVRVFLAAFVFLGPAFGSDAFLVVPNAQTSTPGTAIDNIGAVGGSDFHFQEIVDNTEFPVGGKILINQIALRAAPGTGPITLTTMTILSLDDPIRSKCDRRQHHANKHVCDQHWA